MFRLDTLRIVLFCFFLEGFEKGDDEEDYDEDKWKGGQDGSRLQAFESAGPKEDSRRQGLNDAPGEFDPVRRVEAAVGG